MRFAAPGVVQLHKRTRPPAERVQLYYAQSGQLHTHRDLRELVQFAAPQSEPEIVRQLPNEARKLRRFFERWAKQGEVRSCNEASGAGYALHRDITEWGHACAVIAPSLTGPPSVPGAVG